MLYNIATLKLGGMGMNCIKCGRELSDTQVFCPRCLEQMEQYPVKPGTPVLLPPTRPNGQARPKKHQKTEKKPEEQVQALRSALSWLTAALVVALLAFALCAGLLLHSLTQKEESPKIGQNYTLITEENGMFHVKHFPKENPNG